MAGDWRLEDLRIVISREARNLSCRPLNEECLKAEIRSTKASFHCGVLSDTDRDPSAALGMTIRERDTPKKFESRDE